MSIHRIFDAAFPPKKIPPGAQGVLGYIGKQGFATNVWPLADWLPFANLGQFPAYVPDLSANPVTEADLAVRLMLDRGWAPHMPNRRVIVLDGETRQFPAWYERWSAEIDAAGFTSVDYGSLSAVGGNFAEHLWVADWTATPELIPGQTIHGDQWGAQIPFDGTFIDWSNVDDWLMARAGVGPRRGPA